MLNLSNTTLTGAAYGAITVLCWASFNVAAKAGIDSGMSPSSLSLLRYMTPGLVAIPMLIWLRQRDMGVCLPAYKLCVLAVLGGPLFGLIAVAGYQFAPLSYGLLFAPVAVFVSGAVFAAVALKESVSAPRVLGALIMFSGLALLVGVDTADAHDKWVIGIGLFVAAGIMWGGYTVLLRLWQVPVLEGTSAIASFGALFAVLALGPAAWPSLTQTDTAMLVTQFVMQGIVGGILSVIALIAALQRLTAQTVAMLPTFTPAIAMFLAWAASGTYPETVELVGAVVIFLGFAMSLKRTFLPFSVLRKRSAGSATNGKTPDGRPA